MPKGYKIIITDTSCFSLLQKLDALYLLDQLFSEVIATPEIAMEFGKKLPPWVIIQAANNRSLQEEFTRQVDLGEASAIALATEIIYDFLILDDADARRFAENLGMQVKGTIGILVIAKNNGIIPLLKPYFELIQKTNFRISQSILDRVLKDVGEL